MKIILFLCLVAFSLQNCAPIPLSGIGESTSIKTDKNEKGEWQLKVIHPQYESFLASEAPPKSMYTESYLKSKNTFIVQEWNSFFYAKAFPNIIQSTLDYNPNEKYGLEYEYRLYQFFAMVNSQYGVQFNHLGQMDKKN